MFKKLLAFFAAMMVAVAFAAVDVNKATPAELDGIKGIGPVISGKIVDERKKGNFKSWEDFIERVKGVGEVNAAKFSAEGLTVGGAGYKGAATPATKDAKPAAPAKADMKADAKPVTAPAAAKDEKMDPKAEAKAKKEAAKKAKADEKKAKADAKAAEKKEKADAKGAKDANPAAKSDAKADAAKPDAKADAAKPAASAAKK